MQDHWLLLLTPRDQFHRETLTNLKKLEAERLQLIATDYIVSEAITTIITTQKGSYLQAVSSLDWLFEIPAIVRIEWITKRHFFEALLVFRRFNKDKQW